MTVAQVLEWVLDDQEEWEAAVALGSASGWVGITGTGEEDGTVVATTELLSSHFFVDSPPGLNSSFSLKTWSQ